MDGKIRIRYASLFGYLRPNCPNFIVDQDCFGWFYSYHLFCMLSLSLFGAYCHQCVRRSIKRCRMDVGVYSVVTVPASLVD